MWHRAIGMVGAVVVLAAATGGRAEAPATWSGFCAQDDGEAAPCTISDAVDAEGRHDLRFSIGGTDVRFTGTHQGPWWSGDLNGQPAMGYERNRGDTVFSTTDLKSSFEWCDALSAGKFC